jgi:hypothetical protein
MALKEFDKGPTNVNYTTSINFFIIDWRTKC